ncbi:hypothetical protein E2C01_000830 [Portunus trituberculatus]|uniref:Uncharacterized protein n=1 Tax=Portunus trituberculatus TaxID=210409 RepID=A0A5B7CF64_PORTR|nr:hypothetical protein [Portunus trituberculatus]
MAYERLNTLLATMGSRSRSSGWLPSTVHDTQINSTDSQEWQKHYIDMTGQGCSGRLLHSARLLFTIYRTLRQGAAVPRAAVVLCPHHGPGIASTPSLHPLDATPTHRRVCVCVLHCTTGPLRRRLCAAGGEAPLLGLHRNTG